MVHSLPGLQFCFGLSSRKLYIVGSGLWFIAVAEVFIRQLCLCLYYFPNPKRQSKQGIDDIFSYNGIVGILIRASSSFTMYWHRDLEEAPRKVGT